MVRVTILLPRSVMIPTTASEISALLDTMPTRPAEVTPAAVRRATAARLAGDAVAVAGDDVASARLDHLGAVARLAAGAASVALERDYVALAALRERLAAWPADPERSEALLWMLPVVQGAWEQAHGAMCRRRGVEDEGRLVALGEQETNERLRELQGADAQGLRRLLEEVEGEAERVGQRLQRVRAGDGSAEQLFAGERLRRRLARLETRRRAVAAALAVRQGGPVASGPRR